MNVKVEYLGSISELIGGQSEEEITIENISVAALLKILSDKHGEAFRRAVYETTETKLIPKCVITINGRPPSELNGIERKLEHGDRIVLMPIVSGG